MKTKIHLTFTAVSFVLLLSITAATGQIGTRFPSEKKIITDPVTGTKLTFLTSKPVGDMKIYQTHNQWTSDGKWIVFGSKRVRGEAMAVNEKTGIIVQVTEGRYDGVLIVARKSMKLYYMKHLRFNTKPDSIFFGEDRSSQIFEVDLAKLFADSEVGKLKAASEYQRVCGTIPTEVGAISDLALDANEEVVYFRVGKKEAKKHLPESTKIEPNFGPRNQGSGPAGIESMNIKTGEIKFVIAVPFQMGHIQANPWLSGELVFCWETQGKAPQRTWTAMADGKNFRPLFPEASFDWVTHEAIITRDEVAVVIQGHRRMGIGIDSLPPVPRDPTNLGQEVGWGACGTRERPTGIGIINLRTREMEMIGQIPNGSGFWHTSGSPDGRWIVGDDFQRRIYLIDRNSHEMILLSAGHKNTATDHPHPTIKPDGTEILIESAMLSEDNRSMNLCIIPIPKTWLKRKYTETDINR